MKRVLITIETNAEDDEGNEYPHPRHWNWEELVGGDTTLIAAQPAAPIHQR